jgi:hypothetical protein
MDGWQQCGTFVHHGCGCRLWVRAMQQFARDGSGDVARLRWMRMCWWSIVTRWMGRWCTCVLAARHHCACGGRRMAGR